MTPQSRPALFVDRDGTVIEEREYLADPDGVELIPGAADALRAFADAGYAPIFVTNQSGIARGYYDEDAYHAVHARVLELLRAQGVEIMASYHCPHHPDFTGPCDCRKPGTGLYRQAAREHGIDLGASIYVGDRLHDVEPAVTLGGRGFLVRTGHGEEHARRAEAGVTVLDDLKAVAEEVLSAGRHQPD